MMFQDLLLRISIFSIRKKLLSRYTYVFWHEKLWPNISPVILIASGVSATAGLKLNTVKLSIIYFLLTFMVQLWCSTFKLMRFNYNFKYYCNSDSAFPSYNELILELWRWASVNVPLYVCDQKCLSFHHAMHSEQKLQVVKRRHLLRALEYFN